MPRRAAIVTESDIIRAIRAAQRAHARVVSIYPDGRIDIDPRVDTAQSAENPEPTDEVFDT